MIPNELFSSYLDNPDTFQMAVATTTLNFVINHKRMSEFDPASGFAQAVNMSSSQNLEMSGAPSGSRAAVSNQLFMNMM